MGNIDSSSSPEAAAKTWKKRIDSIKAKREINEQVINVVCMYAIIFDQHTPVVCCSVIILKTARYVFLMLHIIV